MGWGSTLGSIQEAVKRAQQEGMSVSSIHLRFLSPMQPGLKEILSRFRQVITVEINYSDAPDAPLIDAQSRRYSQLAWELRARTLVDVDCFSNVYGQPLRPGQVYEEIVRRLSPSQA